MRLGLVLGVDHALRLTTNFGLEACSAVCGEVHALEGVSSAAAASKPVPYFHDLGNDHDGEEKDRKVSG